MMQRTVQVWVNNLSLYACCCGSCLMLQLNRCTFCMQSSIWMLVILFNAVSCFITSMKKRRTLFTWGTFCVHTSPRHSVENWGHQNFKGVVVFITFSETSVLLLLSLPTPASSSSSLQPTDQTASSDWFSKTFSCAASFVSLTSNFIVTRIKLYSVGRNIVYRYWPLAQHNYMG